MKATRYTLGALAILGIVGFVAQPAQATDGWVGCSMTANTFDGYVVEGGDGFYSSAGYAVGGGIVYKWTSPTSRYWQEYRQQEAAYGEPERLVVMFCAAKRPPTQTDISRMLAQASVEAPNATIFVTRQPDYEEGHRCRILANTLAQQTQILSALDGYVEAAVAAGFSRGPTLPTLSRDQTRDGCHANAQGQALLGQAVIAWEGTQ